MNRFFKFFVCLAVAGCAQNPAFRPQLMALDTIETVVLSDEIRGSILVVNFDLINNTGGDVCVRVYERGFGLYSPSIAVSGYTPANPGFAPTSIEGIYLIQKISKGNSFTLAAQAELDFESIKELDGKRFVISIPVQDCATGSIYLVRSRITEFESD